MLPLGTRLPEFSLPDVRTGNQITPETFSGKKGLLVMFICRHCPYVKHVQGEIAKIGRDYKDKSIGILAISSNDAEAYPEDAPPSLREMAEQLGFNFPFAFDESQDVARSFNAVCTPEFYVFDEARNLVYRGQLDESRRGTAIPITGANVRTALDAVLAWRPISEDQKPSIGCSIKWK
jgi:peroxiredoxin